MFKCAWLKYLLHQYNSIANAEFNLAFIAVWAAGQRQYRPGHSVAQTEEVRRDPVKDLGVCPARSPEHNERFQWLATEIKDSGGEATLIRVAQIEGVADQQIVQMFNDARAAEYKEVRQACQSLLSGRTKGKEGDLAAEFGRQQRRFREIKEVDYFKSPAADDAQMILQRLEKILMPKGERRASPNLRPRIFREERG